jgi:membrane protein implicated in regulation of membrane protease activity
MSVEFLNDYAWILWLGLILVFLIVEMATLEFTFLMIALGSLGGLLSGLLGLPWWAQVVVAAILALLLLFAVKPPLLRRLKRGGDPTPTLVEALIGMEATVTKDFVDGQGQVKLTVGETWTARVASAQKNEPTIGDRMTVTSIEGATALVVPVTATPSKKGATA